jgi:hypothetical protein
MKALLVLLVHLLTAVARLVGPGGAKALVAENLLIAEDALGPGRDGSWHDPQERPRQHLLLEHRRLGEKADGV